MQWSRHCQDDTEGYSGLFEKNYFYLHSVKSKSIKNKLLWLHNKLILEIMFTINIL